jgi:hypothetical protein
MKHPSVFRSDLGLDDRLMSVKEFIPLFNTNPGFITSLISRSEFWQSDADFSEFDGYGFLARVYSQAINGDCIYLASPLIAMRRSQTLWKNDWPRYFLVSRQRLLFWLNEKYNLNIKINSSKTKELVYILLLAKATIYPHSDPFWNNTLTYLPLHQKVICQFFRYLFPKSLAIFVLKNR